ncbi:MAG: MBL fold metallo-hydrolase [Treponema sp.]|nr:MBL fold metallo-hydrolase [Treponema sp.]
MDFKIKILPLGPLEVNTLIVSLTDNYVFIVDPAVGSKSPDEYEIVRFLAANNLIPVAVVITHGHFDHVFGLPVLHRAYPSMHIAIHEADREYIGANSAIAQEKIIVNFGLKSLLPSVSNLPDADSLLEDGKTLKDCIAVDNEDVAKALEKWKVIHTPGHTRGSICLYNASDKLLISGDTVFYHSYGRTDLYGGDDFQMEKSLEKISREVSGDTCVYPGHNTCAFPFSGNF